MRRVSLAIMAATAGTAVLVGLKVPHGGTSPTGTVATAPLDPGAGAPGGQAGPAAPSGTPHPTGGANPAGAPASGPVPSTATATKPPKPPKTTTAPTTQTITGSRERAGGYGYVQVKITIANGRMTDITMVEVTSNPNSAARSAPATLIQEALAAQSADIANVSQATYTSNAFKASLQTALSQA